MTGEEKKQSDEDEERGRFGLYISMLNRAAQAYFQKELAPLGVGPGQQAYLLALLPGEEIPQEALARRLAVDRANVTRAVAALESRGLMRRRTSSQDGRQRLLSLTADGEDIRVKVEQISARWLDYLKVGIEGDDWKKVEDILGKIARNGMSCTGS